MNEKKEKENIIKKEKKQIEFYEAGCFWHSVYVLIGSAPIMIICIMCAKLIYIDYVKNNYSFFDKSVYVSNVESHIFEANVSCVQSDHYKSSQSSDANCFRYFNDFILDKNEAGKLVK
jgi:hypothetical protein